MLGFAGITQIHVDMYSHSLKKQVRTIGPAREGLWSPCCALTGDVSTTAVSLWFPQCRSAALTLKDHARPPENSKFQQSISSNDASGLISLGTFIWSLALLLWKTLKLNPDVIQMSSPQQRAFPSRVPGSSFEVIIMAKQRPQVATLSCRDSHPTIPWTLMRNISSYKPFAF